MYHCTGSVKPAHSSHNKSGCHPLSLLILLCIAISFCFHSLKASPRFPENYNVIIGKNIRGSIILPENSNEGELSSAKELSKYLYRVLNAESDIIPENEKILNDGFLIYLGSTEYGKKLFQDYGIDEDGFAMATRNQRIILYSDTIHGYEFSVYYFIQNYLKVRWFIPGELGEDIPSPFTLYLRPIKKIHNPSFDSRMLSGLGAQSSAWEKRNLLRSRFTFSHNLGRIFKESDFQQHPDWLPLINGKRVYPSGGLWQPDLTNPEVIDHTAAYIDDFFTAFPDAKGISLGINDSMRFDQGENTRRTTTPLTFFRGRPNYSNLYFSYVNQVADKTEKEYSDKYIGCLAYYWLEPPPDFKLNRRIVPYLTADRSQWYDKTFADEDTKLMQSWCKDGPDTVGIYDYYYGRPFFIPRYYPSLISQSLKTAHKSGIRAFYAEAYPVWAFDGPKLWLASQLLWNIRQDPDKLLNEYFERYYGESAKPMRWFHFLCEKAYLNQRWEGRWIRFFRSSDQCIIFPKEIREELRTILEQAKLRARKAIIRKRIDMLDRQFCLFERYCEWVEKERALTSMLPSGNKETFNSISDYLQAENRFFRLVEHMRQFDSFNLGALPEKNFMCYDEPLGRFIWQAYKQAEIAGNMESFYEQLDVLHEQFADNDTVITAWECLKKPFKLRQILKNQDMETASMQIHVQKHPADPWQIFPEWYFEQELTQTLAMAYDFKESTDGTQSIKLEGSAMTFFSQRVPVEGEKNYVFELSVKGNNSPGSLIALTYQFCDKDGKYIGYRHYDRLSYGTFTDWKLLAHIAQAPKNAKTAVFSIFIGEQNKNDSIYITAPKLYLFEF